MLRPARSRRLRQCGSVEIDHPGPQVPARPGGWLAGTLAIACLLTLGTPSAHAAKYAAEFLRIGAGARSLGMGGAVTALIDDASAIYWNPAGMAELSSAEIQLMHAEQFENLADYDCAAFVQPLPGTGAIGVGLIRLAVSDILITKDAYVDANGNHRHDWGEIIDPSRFYLDSDNEYALFFSFARRTRQALALGGSLKLIRQDLPGHSSFGIGIDLAAQWEVSPALRVGARLSDATTTQLYWDTGRRETVVPALYLGTAYSHDLSGTGITATLAADLALSFDGRETASTFSAGAVSGDPMVGLEAWYRSLFAARVGWQWSGVTAGAGFRVRGFGADYAFVPHEDLGSSHRVSASYTF
jgi:hypothetical protein